MAIAGILKRVQMRQGQQNKRLRGRNRKGPNPLARTYESNGPDVKIRGTALHIAEKYGQLARDAQSSGDRIVAESYLQHAEHYYRLIAAAQAQAAQQQPVFRSSDAEDDENPGHGHSQGGNAPRPYRPQNGEQPAFGLSDPQPYINGNGFDLASDEGESGSDGGEDASELGFEGEEAAEAPQQREPRRRRHGRGRGRNPEAAMGEAGAAEAGVATED